MKIRGSRILDLFAGSGALSIEALSRGAESATLVDSDRNANRIQKKNLESLGFAGQAEVMLRDWKQAAAELIRDGRQYDLVFLDPPYDCVFNDYGNIDMMNGFDEVEHRRLAEDFRNLPCRALMVIGKTPLTMELYGEYVFDEYYKNYVVNIKNRFNNDKMHIIVKNY